MTTENDGINLRDFFRTVIKHRSTVIKFFIITFVCVVLGTFAATPLYKSTTKVLIEKANSDSLEGRGREAKYDPEFLETQLQLIQSHGVAGRVVEMLSLEQTYEDYMPVSNNSSFFQSISKWITKKDRSELQALGQSRPELEEHPREGAEVDRLASKIRADIEAVPVRNSRVVAINYRSPNPEFSALVANAFARAYVDEVLDMKMEATRRTMKWMTKKAEEERSKLEAAEKKIQEFTRANNLVTLEDRVAVLPQQLSQFSSQLVRAQTKRRALAALYNKVKKVAGNPEAAETIPAIASDPSLQTLQVQILRAEQNIMELSGKYGKKHPAMIKASGDLRVLKSKKGQEIVRISQSIKNEYELARSAEYDLRSQLNENKVEAQRVNEHFIQYQVLKREMETNRQLYDALLVKIKEKSITGDNQSGVNFWILEEARAPSSPETPRKAVNLFLGLVVGLFGGTGLAFFSEYLDNTIKDPEQAESTLGAPVLGTVSLCNDNQSIVDIVMKETRSSYAEDYKSLRTALLLSSGKGPPGKILITSSSRDEGKTTTATNLAIVLAQSKNRVLLIDGDLRKPSLHKIFKLNNKKGLSTYLAGQPFEGEMLGKGPLPNLSLITSGPVPPNPSELLVSDRMKTLLDTLSDRFDTIICDAPPLLSVSDPRILSRYFDGTIVVAKGGQTTYEMARRTLKSLQSVNANVLGLVINALDVKESDYYYHEYYSDYDKKHEMGS